LGRFVVLLKGVNVGGRHRVPMADLRDLLTELGCSEVSTLLQSGNAVVTFDEDADALRDVVDEAGTARFGFPLRSVVRSAKELRAVVAAAPLADVATDGSKLLVVFLSASPATDAPPLPASGPDVWVVHLGRELHLWSPGGALDAQQLVTFVERRWKVLATSRNWNTVERLAELLDA
jgi:uncharacterized protein (DUF1697 family)